MGTRKQQGPSIESTTALDIAQAAAPRAQTPDHRRFQTLLTRIAKARQRLQDWQEQLPRFAQAYQQQVGPLLLSFSTTRRAWAFELEQRLLAGKWSRDDRQSLSRMISEMAAALLDEQEDLDTAQAQELKALHDRHAEVAYDEAEQQQQHAMKAMAESATGVDLGDGPAESLEEMLLRARAQIQRANEQLNQPGWAHTASGAASGESKPKAKTAAQAARMAVDQVRHFNRVLAEQLDEIEAEIVGREDAFCASYGVVPERRLDPNKLGALLKSEVSGLLAAKVGLQMQQRALRADPASAKRYLKQERAMQREMDNFDGLF